MRKKHFSIDTIKNCFRSNEKIVDCITKVVEKEIYEIEDFNGY
jgi:hypothetical protein